VNLANVTVATLHEYTINTSFLEGFEDDRHCFMEKALDSGPVISLCHLGLIHLLDREVCNEDGGIHGGFPTNPFGNIANCEVDRVCGFAPKELCELGLVSGNNNRCDCSEFGELGLKEG
jgi:hypothetical protein